MHPKLLIPIIILILLSGWFGFRMGRVPGDTQIIRNYAERYLATAPEGAKATDCAATTYPSARMIIVCHHPSGLRRSFVVGQRGQLLTQGTPDV